MEKSIGRRSDNQRGRPIRMRLVESSMSGDTDVVELCRFFISKAPEAEDESGVAQGKAGGFVSTC